MAQPALSYFRHRGVAVKAETVEGTDSTPSTSTNGVLLLNGSSGTEIDKIDRSVDRTFFTNDTFVVGNERGFIEGDFELYPPATPGGASTSSADCEVLLLPAGMTAVKDNVALTTRYNPISASIPSVSAYWFQSGTQKKIVGARANVTGLSMAIGDRFKGHVRIQGDYTFLDAALPSITTPDDIPTVCRHSNSTCTLNTVDGTTVVDLALWAKNLSVDFGNSMTTDEYTAHKVNGISDRKATWTCRIARTALADFNPFTLRSNGDLITIAMRLSESSDLYSELGIRGQIESINEVDIDGKYGWELSGPCIASDTGGDEFYIEFGDDTP